MKRLLTLPLASILATATMVSMAFAADDGDFPTRTLKARHAITTGNPAYADEDMEEDREEEVEAFNELDAQEAMEDRQEVSGEEWQKTQDVQDQDLSNPDIDL